MSPKTKEGDLTATDKRILGLVFDSVKLPKMDWNKLAEMGGYTNVKSAENAWYAAKKKLTKFARNFGDAANAGQSADNEDLGHEATNAKTKRKADSADTDSEEDELPVPKRAKKTTAKLSIAKGKKLTGYNDDEVKNEQDSEQDSDDVTLVA
ncbi:hypothetical protein F5Y19DRAFT_473284 [Xylariaceae sp. FL1651]|nr:hypothetical protein F5Y19DRAFT_473284 [Xylariaceae sp. FL1651]